MKCKNHPDREAAQICSSCNIPICDNCAEEVSPEQFFCFNCAMLQAVSTVGTSIADKKAKGVEDHGKAKKHWGPFHYFVIAACVVISVMWILILFGGEKSPGKKLDYVKQERAFLFMVDSAIKRYNNYEGKNYPERLVDLIPRYLRMAEDDLHHLNMLLYTRDEQTGYALSLANPKPGSLSIILSSQGIKYKSVLPKERG
ncbi:hypothetical protein ACFL1N_14580 [Thermodesulfobacteriota bacterium]